ncbi:DUF5004 domain-containing protein [Parasediminibacterium sp. JCM 36343]|uniref:DUF5004 domain-containing protein n=1 Tax=Parasediminibacterium sp. JCM 36343 TaxID=3374279 RepID=UPI0039799A22
MKKVSLLIMACTLLFACQPEKYKSVGTPIDPVATLAGTWSLSKVTQTDENAKNNGYSYDPINVQTADLTTAFPFTDFKLTLNLASGVPSTFTTVPGKSPKVIKLTSGTWTVDNAKTPQIVTLVSGKDTATVTLGSLPLSATPILKLAATKSDYSTTKPKLLISYSYEFSKQ